jgi:outer membrane protein assembly factor BamD (BamD/ComL family)
MLNLKATSKLVEEFLRDEPQTRNSDSLLYLRILQYHANERGMLLHNIPVPLFLLNMGDWGFPPFESVRRARQKVQATYPELASTGKVAGFRSDNEKEYRAFALGDI